VRFAKKADMIIVGKGVFIEHRFRLRLIRVLDRIEICRFPKVRNFDNRYRTDTDVLDDFDAFPLRGTDERRPRGSSIREDGGYVKFK